MKTLSIFICTGLVSLLFAAASCNHRNGENGNMKNDTTPTTFPTAEQAALQAQEDLLHILRSDTALNLGISDTAALAKAVPGNPVQHFTIDFNKLLAADSMTTLASLQQEELNTIIPLGDRQNLVTVVEVNRANDQWKVASLSGKSMADDLRTVMTVIRNDTSLAGNPVILYEVPNLNAKLFYVNDGQRSIVFTNYNHYSLREGISAASLIPVLKASAVRFQKEFGEQLKKQKLAE